MLEFSIVYHMYQDTSNFLFFPFTEVLQFIGSFFCRGSDINLSSVIYSLEFDKKICAYGLSDLS